MKVITSHPAHPVFMSFGDGLLNVAYLHVCLCLKKSKMTLSCFLGLS